MVDGNFRALLGYPLVGVCRQPILFLARDSLWNRKECISKLDCSLRICLIWIFSVCRGILIDIDGKNFRTMVDNSLVEECRLPVGILLSATDVAVKVWF